MCAKYGDIILQHLQYEIIDRILYKILRHYSYVLIQITCLTHARFAQFVNRQIVEYYCGHITLISNMSDLHLYYNFIIDEIVKAKAMLDMQKC